MLGRHAEWRAHGGCGVGIRGRVGALPVAAAPGTVPLPNSSVDSARVALEHLLAEHAPASSPASHSIVEEWALLQRVLDKVREEGLVGAVRFALHRRASRRWDRRLGVQTAGDFLLVDDGLPTREYQDHTASSVLDLKRVLGIAAPHPDRDVFVDFGSGKGRAVLFAATMPFRRVIGVEISPTLVRLARENVEIARPHLRCQEVEIIETGADTYELPEDASVLYFYNPFHGGTLERVVANIRRSLDRSPRTIRVAFATPPHFERLVGGESWVRRIAEFEGLRQHVVYECGPGPRR